MSQPRFTFCIPNLNKIEYLPTCIESVLAQDCDTWRCVIVDGYSTDGSWEYLQQFTNDPRFLIHRGIKQGMYADWNECLKQVETEYFYFLTSDDTCFPSLVSKTVRNLDVYPDIDACHFQFAMIDESGQVIKTPEEIVDYYYKIYQTANQSPHRRSGICEFMMHLVYRTIYTTITSLVFRSNLISKLKGFKTEYGPIGDFDWTMRLVLHTDVLYIPELLATWRIYPEQATQAPIALVQDLERVLTVAKCNLAEFEQSNHSQSLKRRLNHRQLLAEFESPYAGALYRESLNSKDLGKKLSILYQAFSNYPLYPLKRGFNYLSKNQLYPYQPRLKLAQEIIESYGLNWPPLQINEDKNIEKIEVNH